MQHLDPKSAYAFLQTHPDAVFIDVRSEMEFLFVGHPRDSIHIPWNEFPDWEVNPQFLAQVRRATSVNRPLVLICRSGNRSSEAGLCLEQHGSTEVYNVAHGFEGTLDEQHHRGSVSGWRFDGLPWEQC
jgi:rhodanese-related sulfurtransferase